MRRCAVWLTFTGKPNGMIPLGWPVILLRLSTWSTQHWHCHHYSLDHPALHHLPHPIVCHLGILKACLACSIGILKACLARSMAMQLLPLTHLYAVSQACLLFPCQEGRQAVHIHHGSAQHVASGDTMVSQLCLCAYNTHAVSVAWNKKCASHPINTQG